MQRRDETEIPKKSAMPPKFGITDLFTLRSLGTSTRFLAFETLTIIGIETATNKAPIKKEAKIGIIEDMWLCVFIFQLTLINNKSISSIPSTARNKGEKHQNNIIIIHN